MKYLLLDTNIYLDMVISRTETSPPEAIKRLDNLLRWETASLIVPEIVIQETRRYISKLVNEIDHNVSNIIKQLEDSYWINTESELPKYKEVVRETTKSLKEYKHRLDNKKENYIKGINIKINRLFDKAIVIKTDNDLISEVVKRKIHKKCPLHTNKQSEQDALIIETLVNIKRYISIEPGDEIYFITKNYKDFSKSKNERETFHDDIQNDIIDAGLSETIRYRNLLFKTLKDDFDVEFITASEIQEEHDAFLASQGEGYADYLAEMHDVFEEYYKH